MFVVPLSGGSSFRQKANGIKLRCEASAIDHCQLGIGNCFAGKDSQTSCETIANAQLAMVNGLT
jgi:hypothetical protein